jgi:hypothetical protein
MSLHVTKAIKQLAAHLAGKPVTRRCIFGGRSHPKGINSIVYMD